MKRSGQPTMLHPEMVPSDSNPARRILVVEDAFTTGPGGVFVLPKLTADTAPASPADLELRTPSGTARTVKVEVVTSHVRGPLPPYAMLRIGGVSVDEVPVGSELWTLGT